ncbi:LD-carboxypeptidase [Lentzea jiangxiensis]|uniref:Muramoyltetrapeptide carboxypeptidase n=1 Tax=Lentzea jiangxiensis TaxID=641025 RepID=A0A1H0VFR7_9PSEU|nr:LD-carboxypeptidase [Lentzea jiangxiensis]SDP77055.1 muramoyltetrapeptide carboxypeptidase [Lentzea jiangxiensis]
MNVVLPPRVVAGDRVRLVSPASCPSEEVLAESVRVLESWGLVVEVGEHALDRHGYLAGRDADRPAGLDDAYRDPGVRAVIATRGGAGAYRIAHDLGFDAVRADPKPLVGFSDITNLHPALWRHCRVTGVHGFLAGARSAAATRSLLMDGEPVVLHRDRERRRRAPRHPRLVRRRRTAEPGRRGPVPGGPARSGWGTSTGS